MALEKPQQFLPKASGSDSLDNAQEALAQVTQVQRNQGLQKRVVEKMAPTEAPGRGIQMKPGQTVDIPHSLGKQASSIGLAGLINPMANAASQPSATPNLQVIELPGDIGKRMVRVRYLPPKDDDGNDLATPQIRAKLELG